MAAGVVLLVWILNVVMVFRAPRESKLLMISVAHGVTGAMLLAAAALTFAVWRITGTTRAACAMIGLTVAGVSAPVLGVLTRGANSNTVGAGSVELLAGIIEALLAGCVAGALLLPAVVSRLRPLAWAAPLAAGVVLAAAAIMAAGPAGTATALSHAGLGLRIAVLIAWAALTVAFLVSGRRRRRSDIWLAAGLLVITAKAGVRVAIGTIYYHANLVTTGSDLVVACLIAGATTIALWYLHTGTGTRLLAVRGQLREARTDLADLENDQARRLHDARNAIFAIAGATELLAHPTGQTDVDADHLQRLVTAELDRLGHLLDPGYRGASGSFTAAELIGPLVTAYRARGVNVTATIARCTIHGRREPLAGAIGNVLANARVHAPGARIWIDVAPTEDDVRITIADDGPGIPAEERAQVVLPGGRGSAAVATRTDGSGLGLASASQALSEAGGTLRLSEREGGGTLVTMTVPARTRAQTEDASTGSVPGARRTPDRLADDGVSGGSTFETVLS